MQTRTEMEPQMHLERPFLFIGNTLLLFALLGMVHTANGQNRAGFQYKLDQACIDKAGWSLAWVAKGKQPIQYQVCSKHLKVLLGPVGYQIPVDVWSFESDQPLFNKSGTAPCIDGTLSTNTPDSLLVLQHRARPRLSDPIWNLQLGYSGWVFGASAIAARVRFAFGSTPETGVSGFNFAFFAGRTWGRAYINPRRIIHAGLTVAPFVGVSTTEMRKNVYTDETAWVSDRTAMTVSYGGNVIISRNQLGLVISYGYESVLGPNSSQWIYNWRPWLGVGVAANLGIF
jgi:hypothetical protein